MKGTPIGIGDLVRAADGLHLRGAALEAAAAMCGFGLSAAVAATATPAPSPVDTGEAPGAPHASVPAPVSEPLSAAARRLEPVRRGGAPGAPADPLSTDAPLARGTVPAFSGLFVTRDATELLRLAVSVPAPTDRVNVQRVIIEIAQGRPLLSLPCVTVPSLGLGAQVLVDIGPSMELFWDDQRALVARVEAALRGLADIRYFAGDPMLGAGTTPRKRTWTPYALPRPQTPVIALTDLGCGFPPRAKSAAAWRQLALRLRRRQSRLIAFAPVRLSRLPLDLRMAVETLVWDRSARRRNLSHLLRALDA